jgi:hypothetical protein
MDARPMTAPRPGPSWGLCDAVAPKTQGFVVAGFNALPTGRALFLESLGQATSHPRDG